MEPKITYIRNKKNFPVACLAYICDKELQTATYAVSVHNPKDPYDRKLAIKIACERLNKFSERSLNGVVSTDGCPKLGDIIDVIMAHIMLTEVFPNKKKFPNLLRSAAAQYLKHKNEIGI